MCSDGLIPVGPNLGKGRRRVKVIGPNIPYVSKDGVRNDLAYAWHAKPNKRNEKRLPKAHSLLFVMPDTSDAHETFVKRRPSITVVPPKRLALHKQATDTHIYYKTKHTRSMENDVREIARRILKSHKEIFDRLAST